MKKSFVALVIVFVLSFALVGRANAVEPRMNSLDPDLTIEGTTAYCTILSIVLRKFIFKLNRHGYHTPVRPGSVKSAVHEACSWRELGRLVP